MNVLGLVFSLLLILSYTFFSMSDKHTTSTRVRNICCGTQKTNRQIVNEYQSLIYNGLQKNPTYKEETNRPKQSKKEPGKKNKSEKKKPPELSQECAKLNLSPLIHEGRKTHPQLYELAAKMLRTLYGATLFEEKKGMEYKFLDALIASGKGVKQIEKLALPPEYQRVYYKMLKGTKIYHLRSQKGIAPLTDFLTIETAKTKICLCHAHPDLIATVFNFDVADILYSQLHQHPAPPLTKELIENACIAARYSLSDLMIFDLLELGRPRHEEFKKTLVAHDDQFQVTLRKNVYLRKS